MGKSRTKGYPRKEYEWHLAGITIDSKAEMMAVLWLNEMELLKASQENLPAI